MSSQIRDYLQQEFDKRKSKNSSYSLRAFAKALGFPQSTLSRILNGTRKITPKLADRLLKHLDIDPIEKEDMLLSEFDESSTKKVLDHYEKKFRVLSKKETEVLSWENDAILAMMYMPSFRSNVDWIADQLGLPVERVKEAIHVLTEAGVLEKKGNRWVRNESPTVAFSTVDPEGMRRLQKGFAERAIQEIDFYPADDGHFSGTTMAISAGRVPELIRRINRFRKALVVFVNTDPGPYDRLYRFNLQFFPLLNRKRKK